MRCHRLGYGHGLCPALHGHHHCRVLCERRGSGSPQSPGQAGAPSAQVLSSLCFRGRAWIKISQKIRLILFLLSAGDPVKIDELGFEKILLRCILWDIKGLPCELQKKEIRISAWNVNQS
jgi:hypothetical protein